MPKLPGMPVVGGVEELVADAGPVELTRLVRLVHGQRVDRLLEVGAGVEALEEHDPVVLALDQPGLVELGHLGRRERTLHADRLALEVGQLG